MEIETFSDLEVILRNHDWWYVMSDDHRAYLAGERTWLMITEGIRKLVKEDEDLLVEMINRYSPQKVTKEWLDYFKV